MPRLGAASAVYDIVAENPRSSRRPQPMIHMLALPLSVTIVLCFAVSLVLVILFAAFFFASKDSCFADAGDDVTFELMFELSVHTYTTVGYGSIYPTCLGGQMLVLVEQYVALLAQLFMGACILIKMLNPLAKIRFASSVLISKSGEGWQMQMRVANDTRYSLDHGKAHVVVIALTGRQTRARLVNDTKTRIPAGEHWELRHAIQADSPLAPAANRSGDDELGPVVANNNDEFVMSDEELRNICEGLFCIDVALTFYDTVYDAEVKCLHRYYVRDIIFDANWVDMMRFETVSKRADGSAERLRVVHNHDLLDAFTECSKPAAQATAGASVELTGRNPTPNLPVAQSVVPPG